MATINATLTLSSSDLTSNNLSLSKQMTMTKAGTSTGLELTSGLVRRTFTSTNHVDLITAGAQNYGTPTASDSNAASKVYIKNTGSDSTQYFEVGLGTSSGSGTATSDAIGGTHLAIGRLYGGDWMLIPAHLKATVGDITVQPSTAEKMTIEYMIFFE
tara:strand:+ start:1006 stop:1479 length:474 start_codon:yes stop_codon:yes gene_type:complete